MYRGTTPTFIFKLPIAADTLTIASIAFCQSGRDMIVKTLSDCNIDGNTLSVTLTEEETLGLKAWSACPLEIQIRAGVEEARMASQIFTVPVERILKDGAL